MKKTETMLTFPSICGQDIRIPVVTISTLPSFETRTPFVNPVDGKNPNRFFPGDEKGSYTENPTWHKVPAHLVSYDEPRVQMYLRNGAGHEEKRIPGIRVCAFEKC